MTFITALSVSCDPRSYTTISRSFMTINREQVRSISSISDEMNVTLIPSWASAITNF